MPQIKVISQSEAEGELKDIYTDLIQSRGKLANVHMIQSLNPATIKSHMALYMDIMFAHSPLSRAERELLAVIVSRTNQCEYCMNHHGQALLNYWKDEGKLQEIFKGNDKKILSEKEQLLAKIAKKMTLKPYSKSIEKTHKQLKKNGFDDRAILDIHLVIAYFNFVNRLVLGLGVELEEEAGKGFKY